jgi:dTDP-4-amino-4,6-dideoxygalactose transaminase
MKEIPFFNYPELFLSRKEEYLLALEKTLSRGAFIMQDELFEFENELSSYLGVKHAIGVADGTMAILMSLMASGIKEGDQILVPAHTFIASAAAIHHSGAIPVLVDCGTDHLICSKSVKENLTDKTRAIMPVQLNGRVANMDGIEEIANDHNLMIIEDSCQALGAKFKNRYGGTFGEAGTFSFFPAKTLGCFGDGGAVITDKDEVASKVKMIRDHGRDPADGKVKLFGFNGRLDNIHAVILSLKFKNYDEDIRTRRRLAEIYQSRLCSYDTLLLPQPPSDGDHFDVYQNYEIEADSREELRDFLSKNGIGTIVQWGGFTINDFDDLINTDNNLPYTEKMAKRFMMLPMHHLLSDEDVHFICDKIEEFYN